MICPYTFRRRLKRLLKEPGTRRIRFNILKFERTFLTSARRFKTNFRMRLSFLLLRLGTTNDVGDIFDLGQFWYTQFLEDALQTRQDFVVSASDRDIPFVELTIPTQEEFYLTMILLRFAFMYLRFCGSFELFPALVQLFVTTDFIESTFEC